MITGNRGIATETAQVLSLEGNLDAFITRRLRANSWFNCRRFWVSRFIQRVNSSQRLPFTTPRMLPPLRKNSARRTSSMALLACCRTWNLSYTMRQFGAHCSILLVNGRHISTQAAAMRFLWLSFSWVRKNGSEQEFVEAQ